jgi:deoxyadenosine/deoxycytidine kinase
MKSSKNQSRGGENMAADPAVIVVDGEIGAGKTTLIRELAKRLEARGLRVAVIPEPVDEWERSGILGRFYASLGSGDPEHRGDVAYAFQTYTFVTRVKKMREVLDVRTDEPQVILLERSVLTDRFVFVELLRETFGEQRMRMYETWWEEWSKIVPVTPRYVIYLKPDLESCQTRVMTRARQSEVAASGVSLDYQQRLRLVHEAYIEQRDVQKFPGLPKDRPFAPQNVVVVSGELANGDFSAAGPHRDRVLDTIEAELDSRGALPA